LGGIPKQRIGHWYFKKEGRAKNAEMFLETTFLCNCFARGVMSRNQRDKEHKNDFILFSFLFISAS
jgi:hypothetical protein